MSYGMDARVGISFQNSYGTANVASLHWLEPIGESIDLTKEQIVQEGLRGIYDTGRSQEGVNMVEGDITLEAKPIALGVLLSACFGLVSTVTSGAVITHTFRPRTADYSLLSAERPFTYLKFLGDTGSAMVYSSLNGSQLEMSISNGELLTAKMTVVGGAFDQTAAPSASYVAGSALDWSVSSVDFGGTTKYNVRELSFSLDNTIEAQHTMGAITKYPARTKRTGMRTFDVSGTLLFDDQTEAQQFIAQTEQQAKIYLRGQTAIQSGYYESLLIDMPAMRFTELPVPVGGAGQIEVSFAAVAKYHTGSANAVTITLVNTQPGY